MLDDGQLKQDDTITGMHIRQGKYIQAGRCINITYWIFILIALGTGIRGFAAMINGQMIKDQTVTSIRIGQCLHVIPGLDPGMLSIGCGVTVATRSRDIGLIMHHDRKNHRDDAVTSY